MKYFPLIWYGIWRKRGRAILILLQIAVAFLLFGLLQGMKTGIDDAINKLNADLYIVQRANGGAPLPLAMYSRIQAVPGVKSVSYRSLLIGTYQKPTQIVAALAADVDSAVATLPGITVSKETIAALKRTRTGAIVSNELAAKYGWKTGSRIPLEVLPAFVKKDGSRDWAFDMVGTLDPGDQLMSSEFMIVNYDYFDAARQNFPGTVSGYYLRVNDPKNPLPVTQAIDKLFANSSDETQTESLKDTVQASLQSIGDLDFVIRAIVGAVLFALLFSIGAMLMQSIRERTAELAVLKTVGFSDRKVFWMILTEALVLCVVSALIGLGLASRILPAAKTYTQLDLTLPRSVLLAGIGMAVVLALVSAVMPAWRGLRLQVAEALAGR